MDIDLVTRFAMVFSTLIVIVDPIGVVPMFLALTHGYSKEKMQQTIKKAALFSTAVLILFSLFGTSLFKLLGLNMDAFKAGGGLLLLMTAVEMLNGKAEEKKVSPAETAAPAQQGDISYVPIGIPLLAGPGAITSVMVFSSDHQSEHVLHFAIIAAAVSLTFFISYLILRSSSWFAKVLGDSGVSVVQRLMGIILAALSIQMILDGATRVVLDINKLIS